MKQSIRPALFAAAVVGLLVIAITIGILIIAPASSRAVIEGNCRKVMDYHFPNLTQMLTMDDAALQAWITSASLPYFSTQKEGETGMDIYTVPEGMEASAAQRMVLNGLDTASGVDLSLFLNGSWRLTVLRETTSTFRLRYADFSSGSLEACINNAMAKQGLDSSWVTSKGTDDNGNTYKEGQFYMLADGTITMAPEATDAQKRNAASDATSGLTANNAGDVSHLAEVPEGTLYTWRISCIGLKEMYGVALTDDSYYVGIRINPTEK